MGPLEVVEAEYADTPSIPGQHGGLAGNALAAGYMRAAIQAVYGR